jgi:hypothetical protein
MTSPFDALMTAATAAVQEGQALQQTVADLTAKVAELEAELHPTPPPPPPPTVTAFGVSASSKTQHDKYAALLGNVGVWRYYHQAGEPLTYPTEYALGPGETFVLSGKVLPQNLTVAQLVALFKACPTDRVTRYCVWHEPEDDIANGHFTVDQYKAAWAVARQAQQQVGPHIKLMPILMGYTWTPGSKRKVADYLPDPANFDELGADVYFGGSIGAPVSAIPTGFDAVVATAQQLGKPWGIGEAGVGQRVTGQARLDALALYGQTAKAKGATVVCYFLGSGSNEWRLSPAEAAAWKAGQQ